MRLAHGMFNKNIATMHNGWNKPNNGCGTPIKLIKIQALTDGLYTVLCSRRRVFFRPSYGPSAVSNRAKSRRTKRIKKDYKPIKEAKPPNVSLVNEVRKLYDENPPREPPRPNFKNYNSFY